MSKIRINELARELEVKPGVILDLLPELGVHDKKTHSSSLDDDIADELRRRIRGEEGSPTRLPVRAEPEPPLEAPIVKETETLKATLAAPAQKREEPPAAVPSVGKAAPEAHLEEHEPPKPASSSARPSPIRPPLTGGRPILPPVQHQAPTIPIPAARPAHPPVHPTVAAAPPAAPAPAPVRHPAPAAPVPVVHAPAHPPVPAPPVAVVVPGTPISVERHPAPAASRPAAPVAAPAAPAVPAPPAARAPHPAPAPEKPAIPSIPVPVTKAPAPGSPIRPSIPAGPKPGSILVGPRQALPAGMGDLSRPSIIAPGTPRPPQPPRTPLRPPQQSPAGGPARPPLVGQPAARPVVPPRPDLVAKLTQAPARAIPGQPAPPPPGRPQPGVPIPGRPIFRGPLQPGRGPQRGPGLPGSSPGFPRPMRGRPMGAPPLPDSAPPPATTDRRPGDRRRTAQRTREIEEGKLKGIRRAVVAAPLPVIDKEITISEGITVKEFSEKLGVKAALVIKQLVDRKVFATINQTLDVKLAEDLARAFGATTSRMTYEQESMQEIAQTEVEGDLEVRPPVVTIMGHVDHGKTSLLDAIRETNVAAREAGGITQHIGAYHVETNGRKIVFIDTPGHEAFTRMRARGGKVSDIVILVVAADDGVMPQTREAIDHAKAAKVPIIVAVNKIDKPDAQPERVKQQLTDLGLMPEDWGGDTIFVPVSAKLKQNLDLLLEMILLVSEMQNLRANRTRPAVATVLEAKLDRGRGPVATVLVRNGTLRVSDYYMSGSVFGRVRAMYDDRGGQLKEAGPSMPVEVLGFESLPDVGDTLQVVTDLDKAKQVVQYREIVAREQAMAKNRVTLEQLHAQLREGENKELNLIIKADVGGTAEVLSDTLQKLSSDKISIRVISTGVGAITESDVLLASTSEAIIIGFNVRPDRSALATAEQEKVDIRLHTIIYELTDEIKKAMVGMLEPVFKEAYRGRAEVRETFRISKVGTVAGCYVQDGVIARDSQVRLLRDNIVVHTGKIDALKRFKNDASEVKNGFECGISLVGYNDIKQGDIIEAFVTERIAPDSLN